jgi:hypothetical protein
MGAQGWYGSVAACFEAGLNASTTRLQQQLDIGRGRERGRCARESPGERRRAQESTAQGTWDTNRNKIL